MVKAGLGIGGEHGKGVATCKTTQGWSAPAFFTVSGGSFGLQIGAEGVDLVMLMMNDQGMQALLSDKFQVGGDVSAAAGPVGRDAQAGTDWKLKAPILTYSRSKGVFGGITLNGNVIRQDKDSAKAFYGQDESNQQLLAGQVPPPPEARTFLNAVAQARTVAQR
jgi:lipid-binding SYLF domain-containing protein